MNAYLLGGASVGGAIIGAVLALFVFAFPRIDSLEKTISDAQAAADEQKASFEKEAKDEQSRMQGIVDQANAAATKASADRAAAVARLGVVSGSLRDTISSYEHRIAGLSQASGSCQSDPAAAACGNVVSGMAGYGDRCTAEVERLGDEIRRLEASSEH